MRKPANQEFEQLHQSDGYIILQFEPLIKSAEQEKKKLADRGNDTGDGCRGCGGTPD